MSIPTIKNNNILAELLNHFNHNEIQGGIKVAVYFNLHKDLFSVQSRHKDNYGKVLFHCENINLSNVKFVVREAGRDKVLKEKRKNVHAFCYGIINLECNNPVKKLISYNPYKANHFYYVNNSKPVYSADQIKMVVINKKGKIWELWNNGMP